MALEAVNGLIGESETTSSRFTSATRKGIAFNAGVVAAGLVCPLPLKNIKPPACGLKVVFVNMFREEIGDTFVLTRTPDVLAVLVCPPDIGFALYSAI